MQIKDKQEEQLYKALASKHTPTAEKAAASLIKIAREPLRQGIMAGNILFDIFKVVPVEERNVELDLDLLVPGREKEHVAWTYSGHGYVPERHVNHESLIVRSVITTNAIDYNRHYGNTKYNADRALQILRDGFIKKDNDAGWQTILGAAADRNILVHDTDALPGVLSFKLISMLRSTMRRNGGGNSVSNRGGVLTDMFVSVEALESLRNADPGSVDEVTRHELLMSPDGTVARIAQVNLRDLFELGVGQEYQDFLESAPPSGLGVSLPAGTVEFGIGLDLSHNDDAFIHTLYQDVEIYFDEVLHRKGRMGWYADKEGGYAALDSRRTLLFAV